MSEEAFIAKLRSLTSGGKENYLVKEILAWASANGHQMATPDGKGILFRHTPLALFPTTMSATAFNKATSLATSYNRLVDACARDTDWLFTTLRM